MKVRECVDMLYDFYSSSLFSVEIVPYFPQELSVHIFPFGGQTSKPGRDHVRREMVALRTGL
jgi:hypothetical protein